MKAMATTAATPGKHTIKVLYHVDTPETAGIQSRAGEAGSHEERKVMHMGEKLLLDGVALRLTSGHVFSISNGAWAVEGRSRFLPYKVKNGMKRRLDLTMRPIGTVDKDPIAPHGVIGQTFDRDDKKVIGELDDYSIPGDVIVTRAQAAGAIEGTVVDYEIDRTDPFSTAFKFARFGLSGEVVPRNVSKLSGLVLPAKVSAGGAGALNDEPDSISA
jgi:hypothetical protein